MVYWTYLVHMQHGMPAAKQCKAHAKARGSEITLKHKVILANQRPEEKWKWPNYIAGLLNDDNNNGAAQRAPIESVAIGDAKLGKFFVETCDNRSPADQVDFCPLV